MSEQRIIKKYPNRRLYDTSLGSYITLEDIKQMVFDRIDFQVIDARTQKDLTQSTLLQIIAEQEATSTPIFTTSILQDLIRFYREKSQSAFTQYLEQAMNTFLQQKEFYKNQWEAYQQALLDPKLMEQMVEMQKVWFEKITEAARGKSGKDSKNK